MSLYGYCTKHGMGFYNRCVMCFPLSTAATSNLQGTARLDEWNDSTVIKTAFVTIDHRELVRLQEVEKKYEKLLEEHVSFKKKYLETLESLIKLRELLTK